MAAVEMVLKDGAWREGRVHWSLRVEHPRKEMKVLTASCFLDFSFIESTSIVYLIQDPGDLSPIPDPTNYPEQLIPPDPAPRYRKRVLSSLARL